MNVLKVCFYATRDEERWGWITVTLQAPLNPLQISFNHPWHFLQPHFFYTLSRENTSLTFIRTGIISLYAVSCDWEANLLFWCFSLLLRNITTTECVYSNYVIFVSFSSWILCSIFSVIPFSLFELYSHVVYST